MPIERAKSICEIAQIIINSAKVEIDFLRVVGGKKSEFMQIGEDNELNRLKAVNQ